MTVTMLSSAESGNDSLYGGAGEDLMLAGKRLWFRLWLRLRWRGRLLLRRSAGGGTDTVYGGAPGSKYLSAGSGGQGGSKNPPYGLRADKT